MRYAIGPWSKGLGTMPLSSPHSQLHIRCVVKFWLTPPWIICLRSVQLNLQECILIQRKYLLCAIKYTGGRIFPQRLTKVARRIEPAPSDERASTLTTQPMQLALKGLLVTSSELLNNLNYLYKYN